MSKEQKTFSLPKDGWEGLKENFSKDITSGFVVFLLALPLSLGIARASEFPPIMGVITAIIGGLVATFFTGSKLSIKGPAAGLIVIVAGAVTEFGGGLEGWQLTLGVMVVAGLCQILFGVLKWGKFVDIFPLSAVHGMLAAIGLIIIAKQVPVLLNVDPPLVSGKGPLALFAAIPLFIQNLDPQVSFIGGGSLIIMMGWGFIKHPALKQIPAPLLVLLFAIPAGLYMNLGTSAPAYTLVKVGNLIEQIGMKVDFSGLSHVGIFVKYVIMVALVGSLESLLTVKAVDRLDPWKRKSDPNKDMIAIGIGNTLAAILGGLPMISEVARSSANVANGGRTRWANFFHGLFLLIAGLLAYQLLELIPNAALAAMLIAVGIQLAHPREFIHTYKIGSEQLAIFVTTIFFTLFEDLLVGIATGMLLKLVIHIFRGVPIRSLFWAYATQSQGGEDIRFHLGPAAVFTNYLAIKKQLQAIPPGKNVTIEAGATLLVDHSAMESLHLFEIEYRAKGGQVKLSNFDSLEALSTHPLAARRRQPIKHPYPLPPMHFHEAHLLHELKHYLPSQAALKDFVHHNSLHAFQDKEFFEGIFTASKIFDIQVTFNLNEYRKLYHQGRIDESILDRLLTERNGEAQVAEWKQNMLQKSYPPSGPPRIGRLRALWKHAYEFDLDNAVQPLLFRIIGSYLDQGIALWHFPFENKGLINAIRTLEAHSYSSFFTSRRAKALLASEDLSLEKLLNIVVGPEDYFHQYVFDQQFAHKGWSGIVNAIEDFPQTLLYAKEISLKDFILLELLLEIDALDRAFGTRWQPLATHATEPAQNYFDPVETGEKEEVLKLWHQAFEWDYYDEVLAAVGHMAQRPITPINAQPSFQALFCIDDRECSIRRHIETLDPACETYGAPGFFGAAIYFQPYGSKFYEKNCPVSATPRHLIKEIEVSTRRGHELLHHKHPHTFWRQFFFTLSLGLTASVRLVADLFRPKMRPDIADAFAHMDIHGQLQIECTDPDARENGLQVGYLPMEMADTVQSLLTGIGLASHFGQLIYVVAHGSSSANNPHHGAYDCGACSGRPGAVNARVFAFMANHPQVREILRSRGIYIPEGTQFIGAMHDTASDEIRYYDVGSLTQANQTLHEQHARLIENALDLNAKERARRFASIDITRDIKRIREAIKKRSTSYFEPRPELGHGTNALCYVGGRAKMKGLFLDRRAFLQSYDFRDDPEGALLLKVIEPLPMVCGGINLEYYFSRMDIQKMGAGTKLPHNVMGLIGVANSVDGDLRSGLSLQMIENHDPLRLLIIIEHRPEVVLRVIRSSPAIYNWFDKGWLHLVASSPEDCKLYLFQNGEFVLYQPLKELRYSENSLVLIESTSKMVTNHILDATKENMPVHIYNTKNG